MWFYCSFITKKGAAGERRRKRKKKKPKPFYIELIVVSVLAIYVYFAYGSCNGTIYRKYLSSASFTKNRFSPHFFPSFSSLYSLCGAVRSIHFSWLYLPFIFWICCVFVPKTSHRVSAVCFVSNVQWYWAHFRNSNSSRCSFFFFGFLSTMVTLVATACYLTPSLHHSRTLLVHGVCVW